MKIQSDSDKIGKTEVWNPTKSDQYFDPFQAYT